MGWAKRTERLRLAGVGADAGTLEILNPQDRNIHFRTVTQSKFFSTADRQSILCMCVYEKCWFMYQLEIVPNGK